MSRRNKELSLRKIRERPLQPLCEVSRSGFIRFDNYFELFAVLIILKLNVRIRLQCSDDATSEASIWK